MPELISEEFCIATRLGVSELLESTKRTLDVKQLIRAVERTIEFERLLSERFRANRMRSSSSFDDEEMIDNAVNGEEEASAGGGGFDVEAIRKRWQMHQRHKEKEQEQREIQQLQKQEEEALQATGEEGRPPTNFKGIISSSFDPYMDLYISQEDRNMKEMLDNLLADETWEIPDETRNKVINITLFLYLRLIIYK